MKQEHFFWSIKTFSVREYIATKKQKPHFFSEALLFYNYFSDIFSPSFYTNVNIIFG